MEVEAKIEVVDSSDAKEFRENQATTRLAADRLALRHVHDSAGIISKCRQAMERVTTPYTVFCADDDFLMPDSAQACLQFLDRNADYSCAMGGWVFMNPSKRNSCYQSRCFTIDDGDPVVRFRRLVDCWFSTFYGVYRTELLTRAWRVTEGASDYDRARVFPESMMGQLSVLYGKLAILPQVHLLFELHEQNEHRRTPMVQDDGSRIALYERFEVALAAEIDAECGIGIDDSRRIVHAYYGSWKQQSAYAKLRPSRGWRRWSRNVANQLRLMRDRVLANPTDVWIRRRLRSDYAGFDTPSWRFAFRLASESPQGNLECGLPSPPPSPTRAAA